MTRAGTTARGAAKRTEIIDAAIEVMARVGLAGLSMRLVASQAQMPLGALSYYFDDKSDLVAQAFQQLSDREIERVVRTANLLRPTMSAEQLADLVADMILDGFTSPPGAIVTRYELITEASRNERLRPMFEAWYRAMLPALSRLFRELGSRQPELDSRTVLAVMAGLEIDNLYRPLQPADKRRIRATLRHTFNALLALHDNS
ncbi:TetR family transcriptional regulator [Mycolicibacterium phlei]|jgi:DNA-binding transcriptional regulator YbjK|uniref:TetR family transcriptional regulator n=1 Tax=Mycolicibacterium phlei DSM 43239 = CCUG 21000 TaxID=1226750 RepID=A0A5N5UTP6_MYCPH|nr:TetR family transcriptional regulator [Mycolicibacterium phlei]VEG09431.1 TetR family transcriptional regulator [Mycobacteroides chelonae]AMO61317.1 HTH-type transcriptional regulator BetI [Mycolicibacterium phlei]EID14107.1 TetR family transcriptional regulator [Mycolicibacterium phlei RIVM601174]KAB7752447.1 TetR family transcriptional regulator [Mycolicibacterium phlei DSM 43239 = CCUG 21000]KXW60795.1 TetR family transcriptional regulator [Mycolicibacterium phlei DSM 43239 = CCUG 21000]